jgi:hypothetical protein
MFANVAATMVGGIAVDTEMARTQQAGTGSALPTFVFISKLLCDLYSLTQGLL